ncbi:hypothetical protein HN385_00940 [archaeon]|nr:hypothetical protein [archaeon]MBT3450626.1 hypothetical protein [archaeon]MBT6868688.1 hypothetical protein [archaeon]MBT7193476.1 hypothetical protein [archaeon]MBT7381067.1 hypothetical protein [archaeon]
MAKFESSRERKSRSPRREGSSRRDDSGKRSFGGRPREGGRRYSTEESKRNSRNRRDFDMTSVTCSACGDKCEVPFKPTSSKPVYCSECFSKNGPAKEKSSKNSSKDFEIINDKLDKIIEALRIKS